MKSAKRTTADRERDVRRAQQARNDDIIWGARAIGEVVNLSPAATYHVLEQGLKDKRRDKLPARRINGRWCASRRRLLAFLIGETAE